MVIYGRGAAADRLYPIILLDSSNIVYRLSFHTICKQSNNVDMNKRQIIKVIVYGTSLSIVLYCVLYLLELSHAYIWGY